MTDDHKLDRYEEEAAEAVSVPVDSDAMEAYLWAKHTYSIAVSCELAAERARADAWLALRAAGLALRAAEKAAGL